MGSKGVALDLNGHIIVVDKNVSSPSSPMTSWMAIVGDVGPLTAGPYLVAMNKHEIVVMGLKVYSASRVPLQVWLRWQGQWAVQLPHGCSCGLQWEHPIAYPGNSCIQVAGSSGSFLSYLNTV